MHATLKTKIAERFRRLKRAGIAADSHVVVIQLSFDIEGAVRIGRGEVNHIGQRLAGFIEEPSGELVFRARDGWRHVRRYLVWTNLESGGFQVDLARINLKRCRQSL